MFFNMPTPRGSDSFLVSKSTDQVALNVWNRSV